MTEQRLMDIELKVLAQEDMTQALSDTIYKQQKEIDELRALCTSLAKRLGADDSTGADAYTHERPPHY